MILYFELEPVAKGRARFTRNGHCYTPAKTREYEKTIAMLAKAQLRGQMPLEGALQVSLFIGLTAPKRGNRGFPSVRPDLDNYQKAVFDALNGIAWRDDSQIVALFAKKFYSPKPYVQLDVSPL